MCFSAEVSFGAGAVITGIAIASLKKAKTTPQKIFACIPAFFAIQQFTEGALWLTLESSNTMPTTWLTYLFLFFAWVIWPFYIPFSMHWLETSPSRRKVITTFLVIGIVISLLHVYQLIFHGVYAQVEGSHIKYLSDYRPKYPWIIGVLYFIPIVFSLFVSTASRMRYLGIVLLVTFLITVFFHQNHLISVWCFFAAATSVMVLWVIYGLTGSEK